LCSCSLATFVAKFAMSATFLVPILLLDLDTAVWASVVWGLAAVGGLSWVIARRQFASPWGPVIEHVGVTVVVIVVTALLGRFVAATFA
jgi:VIT1/CCC1 family predicted Fe2+/Mn2+ transporter